MSAAIKLSPSGRVVGNAVRVGTFSVTIPPVAATITIVSAPGVADPLKPLLSANSQEAFTATLLAVPYGVSPLGEVTIIVAPTLVPTLVPTPCVFTFTQPGEA